MAQQDREFLRQYARGSDEYVRAQPSRRDDETLTQYLRRVGVDDSAATGGPQLEARPGYNPNPPTAETKEAIRQIGVDFKASQQREREVKAAQLAAEQEARRKQGQNSLDLPEFRAAKVIWNKAADTVENIQNWLATRPTPTGRAGMLSLLLIFGAFIIPVSQGGYTRAQLFWLTLLGRTELDESQGSEPTRNPPPHPPEPAPPRPTLGGNGAPPGTATLPFTMPLPGGAGGPQLPR